MSNYCKLFFTDGSSLVVAKLLAWFEEKLGVGFWRIHRSHLVNRNNLIQIQICSSQSKVVLNTGEILPIAKRKKHEVMELMAG